MSKKNGSRRVALVAGLRTPFQKERTGYARLSALDLGAAVVSELLARFDVRADEIAQVVFGQVVPSLNAPNIAREIVLRTSLPKSVEAYSVSRACATSYQSVINLAQSIALGVLDCGIAGGADSISDVPVAVSKNLAGALVQANRARTLGERVRAFVDLKPADLVPLAPAIKELSTGLTMGESAEKMVKENGISREAQDRYAHRSHVLAARAWEDGRLREEVMTFFVPPTYEPVSEDNLVRKNSKLEDYGRLRPAFDRDYGSVTAGNSSPLTDGAAAILLMDADKAESEGRKVLGYLRSHAFSAVDPGGQLLMGPAFAIPVALERAGLELADMDLIDMHEAFAGQVLSNTQALESKTFAREKLGRSRPVGTIDWERFNVLGGSIAMGHPFAATGARQMVQTLRELGRRGGRFALCSACAAGGLGAAVVLEAAR